jgi:thiol:disulfide interchange protein
MPEYANRVVFIDASAEDPAADGILERFPAPYVPTSVFISASGEVQDTFVGALSESHMRGRLDTLLSAGSGE